ncbi:hypothetical protein HELRODRAFT_162597 [Helobdella robusta]|uniref:Uncharacterized protein n=1 Tax=Helobdella robusta TaxID=6412 RepID=T1ESW5_HELRO|nr:hypothetical protein HELRODRAFT_162597 [Helobdella robusta]ESN99106.1 hypothetical protein HELRODRAFT_162597 [Helobdella robusta]
MCTASTILNCVARLVQRTEQQTARPPALVTMREMFDFSRDSAPNGLQSGGLEKPRSVLRNSVVRVVCPAGTPPYKEIKPAQSFVGPSIKVRTNSGETSSISLFDVSTEYLRLFCKQAYRENIFKYMLSETTLY